MASFPKNGNRALIAGTGGVNTICIGFPDSCESSTACMWCMLDDRCMCVVNKQFELLEFVFESVYVDLQYDKISLTFTTGFVVMWSSLVCL